MVTKTKKAMMDDLFDMLFTVMVAFFALLFIHVALVKSVEDGDKQSMELFHSVTAVSEEIANQEAVFAMGGRPALASAEKRITDNEILLPLLAAKGMEVSLVKEEKPPTIPEVKPGGGLIH